MHKNAPGGNQGAHSQDIINNNIDTVKVQGSTDVVQYALELGLPVFPVYENKKPATPHGFLDASNDPEVIRQLWMRYPASLIGVPTGVASGIDVLDIDPRHGGDVWLNKHKDRISDTRIQATRSGGLHLFFEHYKGLKNSVSKIAPGVDVRTTGGYVVWWEATGLPILYDAVPAPWPEWLLSLTMPEKKPRLEHRPEVHGSGYAVAALRHAAEAIASAPEGCRNDTLNKEVWSMLRFVKSGSLRVQEVTNALASAALAGGLSRREVISTLTSALRARGIV